MISSLTALPDLAFAATCFLLLALERLTYAYAWRRPGRFTARVRRARWLSDDPVLALRSLFRWFKFIQVVVIIMWCQWFSGQWLPVPAASWPVFGLGLLLVVVGQVLNAGVMLRLGTQGVFYGNKFGRDVPWVTGFPFSIVPHPQYLGALMTVWGVLLAMRYPNPDWLVLPLLSSLYYLLGARLER